MIRLEEISVTERMWQQGAALQYQREVLPDYTMPNAASTRDNDHEPHDA
jgi:hypothetical protein